MKVVSVFLGCKVNKYESDSILEDFKNRGYEVSDKLEKADVYVINTCAVTSEAEKKSRQMIARVRRLNKDAKIYVCGCASQNNLKQFEGKNVELIKGVAGKSKIGKEDLLNSGIESLPKDYEAMTFSHQSKTRAYIKIQDGCNNFCTYCIIPYLRGRSRSRDIQDILNEAKALSENIKEIVLVGINVSAYKPSDGKSLIDLLEELDKLNKRLRLSSLEDGIIDEEFLLRLSHLKNFCPHFHLSLQSGSQSVLKRMNRHYTPSEFLLSVQLIRKYFPLAAITTDVIVGFPEESEEEFNETVEFIKKVQFSELHIFQYSKREGTVAAKFKDTPSQLKKARAKILENLNKSLKSAFLKKNDIVEVLIEENKDGFSIGHSKNFIKCYIDSNLKEGDIVKAKILREFKDGVIANLK